LAVSGGRIALAATLLQIPVGLWVLSALPQQSLLLGSDAVATLLFGGSVLGSLALLHQLAIWSLGDISRRRVWLSTALLCAVVLLMTGALNASRS
jgi:hypothetical protein